MFSPFLSVSTAVPPGEQRGENGVGVERGKRPGERDLQNEQPAQHHHYSNSLLLNDNYRVPEYAGYCVRGQEKQERG